MTELVTLELPDAVVQRARENTQRTGRPLEQVLTEWIGRGAASENSTLLIPDVEYPIYTPYGNEDAARMLLKVIQSAE